MAAVKQNKPLNSDEAFALLLRELIENLSTPDTSGKLPLVKGDQLTREALQESFKFLTLFGSHAEPDSEGDNK